MGQKNKVATVKAVSAALNKQAERIKAVIPAGMSVEKLIATATTAVKNNPKLLECTRLSLENAVVKAAEDGLMPDGREGAIVHFWDKHALGKDKAGLVAQWMPMLFGIRKRALDLAQIVISAEVVHANDRFEFVGGDEERLVHSWALGKARGAMIGAFAIVRQGNTILHREVMDAAQIRSCQGVSKAQNGLMWTKFEGEAWKKTVVRRASKTVPAVPQLARIIEREDEHVDFSLGTDNVTVLDEHRPAQNEIEAPKQELSGDDRAKRNYQAPPKTNEAPGAEPSDSAKGKASASPQTDREKRLQGMAQAFDDVGVVWKYARANFELANNDEIHQEEFNSLCDLYKRVKRGGITADEVNYQGAKMLARLTSTTMHPPLRLRAISLTTTPRRMMGKTSQNWRRRRER